MVTVMVRMAMCCGDMDDITVTLLIVADNGDCNDCYVI